MKVNLAKSVISLIALAIFSATMYIAVIAYTEKQYFYSSLMFSTVLLLSNMNITITTKED